MSLPDIDYELENMGQFEYSVGLAVASTKDDMAFVANAFRAGEQKMANRIISLANKDGNISTTIYEIEKMLQKDASK